MMPSTLAERLVRIAAAAAESMPSTTDRPFGCPPDIVEDRLNPKGKPIDHWCKRCGTMFQSIHPRHLYCGPCSESQDLKRKKLDGLRASHNRTRDRKRDVGLSISKEHARGLADVFIQPKLKWHVRFFVPFQWTGSKNAIYTLRAKGHVALRQEVRKYRDDIVFLARQALKPHKIFQNKLWIDIFVEKASHKGDAINFVDTICDALKLATDLDDRWFCIRSVDWSINKDDPQIIIGIGQEAQADGQVCSYCGRLQELSAFPRNKSVASGAARICRECSKKPAAVGDVPSGQVRVAIEATK